jgi:hypothetical protein
MPATQVRRLFAIGGMLALAACAAGGGDVPSSEPTRIPTPEPTPEQPWTTFTSERYAYAIDHPVDWSVLEQPGNVLPDGQKLGAPGTDTLASNLAFRIGGNDGKLSISAHPLEPDESLKDFTDRFSRGAACRSNGAVQEPRMLGGQEAEVRRFICGDNVWLQLTTLRKDLGYVVWLLATVQPNPENRPINDRFLDSFRFTD